MNWEVSTMQSKRSFFNRTLFRKNLTRFWPLWGGVSLVGSLAPLYVLLELLNGGGAHVTGLEFTQLLYTVAAIAVPVISFGYAILCAMLVWSYLYSPRSVGLMHTLPVDRTCLFVTSVLSGLAMMLIPYAVVGSLTCLIALVFGFFDFTAVCLTILAVALMTVAFFGLATFCAMLTGHVFALPVLYLLVNFLAPLLEALVVTLSSQFLLGFYGNSQGVFNFLAPIFGIYENISLEYVPTEGPATECYLVGFGTLFLYFLAGLALLALGYLLYRRRPSESAGDVAAFRGLRPVFRWGLALLSALVLGYVLYELFCTPFQWGYYANPVFMAVCMALTGLLGWYAASMLLEKSLRVFKGSWKSALAVCVVMPALCFAISVDLFGIEDRVPDLEDIHAVSITDMDLDATYFTGDDPEMVERIVSIHQAILADKEPLRRGEYGDYHSLRLVYTLKNGTALSRIYRFSVLEDRLDDPASYSAQVAALYRDPELMVSQVTIPASGTLTSIFAYDFVNGYGEELLESTEAQSSSAKALYEAILQDAREGNIPGPPVLPGDGRDAAHAYDFRFEIEYRTVDERGGYQHRYDAVQLYPTMKHTIGALLDLELVTEARVELWNQTLIDQYGEDALG